MASYSLEYSRSGRANCKSSKCKAKIAEGALRMAKTSQNDERMDTSFTHWECVWPATWKKLVAGAKSDPSNLHGFDKLEAKDQKIVTAAFKSGKIAKSQGGEASTSASTSKEGDGSKKRKATSKKPRDSKLQSDEDDLEEETSRKVKKGK